MYQPTIPTILGRDEVALVARALAGPAQLAEGETMPALRLAQRGYIVADGAGYRLTEAGRAAHAAHRERLRARQSIDRPAIAASRMAATGPGSPPPPLPPAAQPRGWGELLDIRHYDRAKARELWTRQGDNALRGSGSRKQGNFSTAAIASKQALAHWLGRETVQ